MHSPLICTLMFCPLIVQVYSCFPLKTPPLMYNVMLVGSDDCEQVSGPLPDPPHCTQWSVVRTSSPLSSSCTTTTTSTTSQYTMEWVGSSQRVDAYHCVLWKTIAAMHQVDTCGYLCACIYS